jgi:hypothetical protein
MPKKSGSATKESTYEVFATDEPFKVVAKRLLVSPNTLRAWWVEKFGQEAFDARGKAIQAKAAVEFGHTHRGSKHTVKEVEEPCAGCGSPVRLNLAQKARLLQVLCQSCETNKRGVDRECPVCGLGCSGLIGLSSHMAQVKDEAHQKHLQDNEAARWVGKLEGVEYVRCRICNFHSVSLARHLKAEHSITADSYRSKFPGALVVCQVASENKSVALVKFNEGAPRKGLKKKISCPSCGLEHEVALSLVPSMHETRCQICLSKDEEAFWASKIDGQDYVTCQVCGYRAESLISHIRNTHPELEGSYKETFGSEIIASNSDIRKKSEVTKTKLSISAGRWNLGLTNETSPSVASASRKKSQVMIGIRANRFWRSVDTIELSPSMLTPFKLKNGKISVGKAMAGLGHCFMTIQRECEKHGLQVSRNHIREAICLENISKSLHGAAYDTEWSDTRFVNSKTGCKFRYDGFFPSHNLIVEFHGFQHWTFPSFYIDDEAQYVALQERDRIKENLIQSDPVLRYFLVREDEPYADPEYIRGRLIDEGYLEPGK